MIWQCMTNLRMLWLGHHVLSAGLLTCANPQISRVFSRCSGESVFFVAYFVDFPRKAWASLTCAGTLANRQPHEVKNRLTHNKVQTANALTVWRTQTGAGTSAPGFPIWVTSGFLETLTVQTPESTACGVSEPPFQSTDFRFTKLSLSTAQWKCFFYLSE